MIDGKAAVILFDSRSNEVMRIGGREWEILAAADGTRDAAGIVIAAGREGVRVAEEEVARFLAALVEQGMVVLDPEPARKPEVAETAGADDRPVRVLPNYSLHCDRSGRCCRMYATVLMTHAEAERARSLVPEHSLGSLAPSKVCLPVRGSVPGAALAMGSRDGACGYLEDDGGCAVHRVGGAEAKPFGCRLFPTTFIDDGTSVRVSIKTECACVLDSAGKPGGELLLDPTVTIAGQLPGEVVVGRLPSTISLTEVVAVERSEVVAFVDAWLDAPAVPDVARSAWAMADAISGGFDPALSAWADPGVPDPERVAPYLAAMGKRASARSRVDARWRSAHDRARVVGEWIALTSVACSNAGLVGTLVAERPECGQREAFFVRANAFAYGPFADDYETAARGLRDLAIKLWTARAMPMFAGDHNNEDPLTSLEAWLRAYGVWRYVLDV